MMAVDGSIDAQLRRIQLIALATGVLGLIVCGLGLVLDHDRFFESYLFAFMFWLSFALGGFGLVILHHLTGGRWGTNIRRFAERAAMTLPLMVLLFVPILLGMNHLYEWSNPEVVAADPLIRTKLAYLNVPFFLLRAALYFAIWIGGAYLLNRWSLELDRTGDPALIVRMRRLSALAAIGYVLTMTFAAFDWVMSLDPHWFSSIFGLLFIAGQGLMGMSLMIIVANWFGRRPQFAQAFGPDRFNDLGNLLLLFVMFWMYITLSQYLIIWAGNLPEEVTWYLDRSEGGWLWVILFVLVFQFVLPLLLLMLRGSKRNARFLALLAGTIVVVHLVELFWLVIPTFHSGQLTLHWLDLAAPLAIGGLWLAAFIWLLRRGPLLPVRTAELHQPEGAASHG